MHNGQLTIMVSALQTIQIISEGNTFIVNCQFSIVNFLSGGSPIKFDLCLVQKGFDVLGYGTFCCVGAGFIEAIHLGQDAVFLNGADHPAFV